MCVSNLTDLYKWGKFSHSIKSKFLPFKEKEGGSNVFPNNYTHSLPLKRALQQSFEACDLYWITNFIHFLLTGLECHQAGTKLDKSECLASKKGLTFPDQVPKIVNCLVDFESCVTVYLGSPWQIMTVLVSCFLSVAQMLKKWCRYATLHICMHI